MSANRIKPTELDSILGASLADGDWFVVWDTSTGTMYKIAKSEMASAFGGGGGNMSTSTYDPAGIAEQLVGLVAAQTLTNKTIDADSNTISNIGDEELKAGINATKIGNGDVANDEFSHLNGVTSAIQTQLDNKQPLDAQLTSLAALVPGTEGRMIESDGLGGFQMVTASDAVNDAGAVMNSDTSTAAMSFVVDEDNMASNSATKVPTQQSVKAYVDTGLSTKQNTITDSDDITEGAANLFMTTSERSKLSGIEAGADVTDTANVTAAGALMDSEVTNLAQVKSFDSADYAAAAHTHTLTDITDSGALAALDAVGNAEIDNDAVTFEKIENIATNRVLARSSAGSGSVEALTLPNFRTLINVEDGADVTDTANVTAAGALMDSELADISAIKTLSAPDNTTISTFGATLVDDADASAARTTLGLGTLADDSAIDVAIGIACSDESTALTTGSAKVTFRMPYAMTLTDVRASLTGAGSTSGTTTIDINESGSTILSTKLTIDQGEKTSETAATAAVISDSALADDAEITIDIDAVTGGADETGLKVWLIGTKAVS